MATNTTTPARWLVALLAVLALGLSGCVIQQADGDPDAGDKPGTEHTDHGDGEDKDNGKDKKLSLIHISEPTRRHHVSRMPSSA